MGSRLLAPTGQRRHYTAAQTAKLQRLDEIIRRAERTGDHVWTALVVYLANPGPGTSLILDAENLVEGPLLGCYRCEQPYSERLARRRCAG